MSDNAANHGSDAHVKILKKEGARSSLYPGLNANNQQGDNQNFKRF